MQVNITKRIGTPEGRRYCPVIFGAGGRVKPDWVMVDDRQEKHPEGAYYLDWTENGKRRRMAVGTDATAAYNSRNRKQSELEAMAQGLVVTNPIADDSRLRLRDAKEDFLEDIQLSRQRKTWLGYCLSLSYFMECCSKTFVEDIDRKDILRFAVFLRDEKELAPRTVHNKFAEVLTFLQAQGVPRLISKNDRPRFVEQEVQIYEDDQLQSLHAACSLYHSTQYDFFLMSGFREQETMHLQWENIRFNSNIVEMRWKPWFRWTPKAYKEREVPVPTLLLDRLDNYRRTLPATRASAKALVFSTRSGKRDTHMLRALKRNANKAGLDQDDYWLHKFRASKIHYVDVGTSGGVWGLERGYCMMIGGEREVVEHLDPLFSSLAPGIGDIPRTSGREKQDGTAELGYLHCGPNGAGHFVKMVHNGIEYGLMAAYAEGLGILREANVGMKKQVVNAETTPLRDPELYQYEFNLREISEVWRRGSVIASWLLDLTAAALVEDQTLSGFAGRVSDSGEGRWTINAAVDEGVPAPVLSAALFERFGSRGNADYQDKLLSAMRFQFGGHVETMNNKQIV